MPDAERASEFRGPRRGGGRPLRTSASATGARSTRTSSARSSSRRFATFIILSIAIMVASFCIVCTLLLMVTEKGKEIAILKAIGATDGAILRIFMIEGIIIGGIGTVLRRRSPALAFCTGALDGSASGSIPRSITSTACR